MAEAKDPTVRLELAAHGSDAKEAKSNAAGSTTSAYIIDVNQAGNVSVSGIMVTHESIRQTLRRRIKRQGATFEVWIRGDGMAKHEDISKVMDVCSEEGIGRVTFLAIQGDEGVRTDPQKAYLTNPKMTSRQYKAAHPGNSTFRSRPAAERYRARTHAVD
jgi:biopolymer transport protein ExbD